MRSSDFNAPVNLRDGRTASDPDVLFGSSAYRLIPNEGQRADGEEWGSWIDPYDARDALRVDTMEATRSELRVKEMHLRTAREKPAPTDARSQTTVLDPPRTENEVNTMPASTGIATVFLDRQLRVLRFTPAAREIGYDRMAEVVEDARSVLDTLRSKQSDIQASDGRWYRMHVDPYGTLEDTNEGVVISLVDISERREVEQEIARQLTEKETLLKEVHHRVRNNTASIAGLLSIQAQSIVDVEARSVLQGAIGRVESMSVLYDKLLVSEQYGASSVKDYFDGLADSVMALFPERTNITLETHVADFDVKTEDLFVLGLITNELLTNIMKYAFVGRSGGLITLALERSGDHATLIVQDDGVGLPPRFDPESAGGFGLTLVRMLSDQLDGIFSVSSPDGTRCVLDFDL